MWDCDGKEGRAKKPSEGIKEEVIMKNEKWKSIAGYEGLYQVSDEGRVRSLNYNKTGKVKVLSPGVNKGYLIVYLCKNGKRKFFCVHRVVYEAFRGPIPPGMEVNHINEDKADNRLSNLEIVTHKENLNHGTRNERAGKAVSKQLDLMLAEYPYTELTFPSSCKASEFFRYKAKDTVGVCIFRARKRGENWINLRRKKYYFAQAD